MPAEFSSPLVDFRRDSKCLLIEDLAHAAFADELIDGVAASILYEVYTMTTGIEALPTPSLQGQCR